MRDFLKELDDSRIGLDPNKTAQTSMKQKMPKRFYKAVSIEQRENGFHVLLDGKTIKTPARNVLAVPIARHADLLAMEFAAQQEVINPTLMPVLRITNSAIDGVADQMDAVFDDMAQYFGSDLLCYRVDAPDKLVVLQNGHWQPITDWATRAFDAPLKLAAGINYVEQHPKSLSNLRDRMRQMISDPFTMASAHVITTASGSAILASAYLHEHLDIDAVWHAATLDEQFSESQWGVDAEAVRMRAYKEADLRAAASIISTNRV